ncbi:MAG: hypothetical protein JJE48_06290 [Actinobacteria bacterium]|nr:hypothetical protein [Actinomycetota bacterium]
MVITRILEEKELERLVSSIGSMLVAEGFMPQGNVPGLYVYEKKKRPSVVITILLLLLLIIPGIVYLLLGGSRTVVSIQVTEVPLNLKIDDRDKISIPIGLGFGIKAPGSIGKRIVKILEPHEIDPSCIEAHPEQLVIGMDFQKKVQVGCDHCGMTQEAAVPLHIKKVEGDRGYGPGGKMTVTCTNPDCGRQFDVTWDNVIVQLDFKH